MTSHDAEFRRCLVSLDVPGIQRIWRHTAPHLAQLSPQESLVAMHIARVEMRTLSRKLKAYSLEWLMDHGYERHDGKWSYGPPPQAIVSEAVGIASRSNTPGLAKKVTTAMRDALLNGMAKGITEPPMQREIMLKARAKVRFKERI